MEQTNCSPWEQNGVFSDNHPVCKIYGFQIRNLSRIPGPDSLSLADEKRGRKHFPSPLIKISQHFSSPCRYCMLKRRVRRTLYFPIILSKILWDFSAASSARAAASSAFLASLSASTLQSSAMRTASSDLLKA